MEKILKFPDKFLWGSSTSAYQVEGGIKNCDWARFKDAGIACDHYNRYNEDFDLLKKLNQNAFRLSIEWSRIEPEQGKFDEEEIGHYKKVLASLKERRITSFVALYHWTVPLWFEEKGGWLSSAAPGYFQRYAEKVAEKLGDDIDFWITINEPLIYAAHSYFRGEWPPKKKGILKTVRVIRNLIRAHKMSYNVIHRLNQKAKVSIAKNNIYFEPSENRFFNKLAAALFHYFWNRYFLNSIKSHLDFIGLNYYFHSRIKFSWSHPSRWFLKDGKRDRSDVNWEIYPEGIYWAVRDLARFEKPIYITENGIADAKDKLREKFIRDHLIYLHRAIQEGIKIEGYLHWSLMDNMEWDKGFWPRFGLIEIDYKNLERKPRPSAFYYAKICEENSLIIDK